MKAWNEMRPIQFSFVYLCLFTGLLLAACTQLARPAGVITNPTGESLAATTSPSTELQSSMESSSGTISYFEFERTFSFAFDPVLAQTVEPMTVEAVSLSQNGLYSDAHPAFVRFTFLGYDGGRHDQLPSPSRNPLLMAIPTQYFQEYNPDSPTGFPRQLEELRGLLETRPDLAERCIQTRPAGGALHLPFLPWLNEAQVFCAQPQYVEFSDGKGIRYLTAFSQGITPLVDSNIFYTFQGLSEDGEIYFSATFPVLTGIFPLEIHPGVEGQLPQNMNLEQLGALNAQPGELFQPALGQLDALIESLKVEK